MYRLPAARRCKDNVAVCPTCGSTDVSFVASRRLWQCKTRHPKAQFSIKVGTIFEDSPLGMDKWMTGLWLLVNCKNGISSYEISRATGLSQKSTWFMLQRIRLALEGENGGKLDGEIEFDEIYIGGKSRNVSALSRFTCSDMSMSRFSPTRAISGDSGEAERWFR